MAWIHVTRKLAKTNHGQILDHTSANHASIFERDFADGLPKSTDFPYAFQILSMISNDNQPNLVWEDIPDNNRGLFHLLSAIRLCDQAGNYYVQMKDVCESNIPNIGNALLSNNLLPLTQPWACTELMEWVVLSDEVQNNQQQAFWKKRLQKECPAYHSAYAAQNADGRMKVAEAYGRLGMYDRAIEIGEDTQENSKWSWGHFIVAGFYTAIDATSEAEQHLLNAIDKGKEEEFVSRYHFALAELYLKESQKQKAVYHYCIVLNDVFDNAHTRRWKPRASSALEDIFGYTTDVQEVLCDFN